MIGRQGVYGGVRQGFQSIDDQGRLDGRDDQQVFRLVRLPFDESILAQSRQTILRPDQLGDDDFGFWVPYGQLGCCPGGKESDGCLGRGRTCFYPGQFLLWMAGG